MDAFLLGRRALRNRTQSAILIFRLSQSKIK